MNAPAATPVRTWLLALAGLALLGTYFLPWVNWDATAVAGDALPRGSFFAISESQFKLGNPFPQLAFTFYSFWLIPALTLAALYLSFRRPDFGWAAWLAAALTAAQLTVYYLFSNTLADLGVKTQLAPAYYGAASAALLLSLSATRRVKILPSLGLLILMPLLTCGGFKLGEKYVMSETFAGSETVKADYTVNATDLISEFLASDSTANRKYREKMIVVNGTVTQTERQADSTTVIQLADSTGSYIAFSFEPSLLSQVQGIKAGDAVSLKGSCSGSIYSEILGTTVIQFKRSTLNKQ